MLQLDNILEHGRPFLIHDQHIADIQPREQISIGFTICDLVYE